MSIHRSTYGSVAFWSPVLLPQTSCCDVVSARMHVASSLRKQHQRSINQAPLWTGLLVAGAMRSSRLLKLRIMIITNICACSYSERIAKCSMIIIDMWAENAGTPGGPAWKELASCDELVLTAQLPMKTTLKQPRILPCRCCIVSRQMLMKPARYKMLSDVFSCRVAMDWGGKHVETHSTSADKLRP